MTDLSPAAQAVLDAFTEDNCLHDWKHNHYNIEALAAALRAVADQVAPDDAVEPRNYLPMAMECQRIRRELLALAAELENEAEVIPDSISEKENDRRLKECLKTINDLQPGELTKLMGEAFMEEFRRVSQ